MRWPWLTQRAAEADRALAYAEGAEAARAECLRTIARLQARINELERGAS